MTGKFLYFAYGSNLLAQRIHINNPSAVRAGIAKLNDYRLDFVGQSSRWKGAPATIVPHTGKHVWGALWELDNADKESLDRQEGVDANIYFPLEVEVESSDGKVMRARTYRETAEIKEYVDLSKLPAERQPSTIYLKTILTGAKESGLPSEYQEILKTICDNGYQGDVDIGKLNLIS
ncbi:unnamed protein product [Acanthoscelides obtectus]|nr:unnamed protein product [Acanthoscelides obtectus]CAK1626517.1 Gamma-glutamylcyclotransferase [Acanthoscelides obtectus]